MGADGRHSAVAKAVGAAAYHVKPALSSAYYTYWSGVALERRARSTRASERMVGAWPTNDGLVDDLRRRAGERVPAFRADPEAAMLAALDAAGDLGERVRAGERAERVCGTRRHCRTASTAATAPAGRWSATPGCVMDPITGQGIADAFRDAELLRTPMAAGWTAVRRSRRSPATRRGATRRRCRCTR